MSTYFRKAIILGIALLAGGMAQAQTRPPIGGIGQLPDTMIFYVAHGGPDACGPGCSDWIAAEGTVQFDTFKRLIAILDRQADHKLPVVINSRGQSNINVAASICRILRDRGIDVTVGGDRGRGPQRQARGGGMLHAEAARRPARRRGEAVRDCL